MTLMTGLEPEFSLLKRSVSGQIVPCEDSDTLAKPCYDYKACRARALFSTGWWTAWSRSASTSTGGSRGCHASSKSTTPTKIA